ncbi:nitrite reductase (NAD(P)H) small subunit [Streptomyces mobaraensis NBRC 13819 = DSM 40847]|uniref:Nitrite reductase (NAD(P)H) small subunit n=2 Tax=Streptomyces mobaraensis TaxID=35621 RepID=A0A5N5W772_STRMB|nr:nitrite reductase (NAD(P)H), small subunit [Streptomyces mobaraensis NBRC 13819 = DSM 40847]KAB7843759.1 nitrite reductase (NAD(P)H) small subunit [Streptomyces mobaraensis]QTT72295.1 nitrite reductase (NAD(P)H) small subunit [Streptomyces mobaraensis NBRC 13819 = DSM 40847]
MTARRVVEVDTGGGWTPVCAYDDLIPGRGVAALVGGHQVAVFRDRAGRLYAVGNRDPFSGAYVVSRGLLGSRDGVPVVVEPMYHRAFDLRSGACADEPETPGGGPATLPVWPVRLAGAAGPSGDRPAGATAAPSADRPSAPPREHP